MTNYDGDLAHSIMMKFGTAPGEPNESQLTNIKQEIDAIRKAGSLPSEEDWRKVVKRFCPSAGSWIRKGVDNSDLNTLLLLAIEASRM